MKRQEGHLLDKKTPQNFFEEKLTLKVYKQVLNGFESEKTKTKNYIPPVGDEAKKYENLEDGEIIDENSCEAPSAELITNKKMEKVEQKNSETTPKELKRTVNEGKVPLEIDKAKNSETEIKYEPEGVLMYDNKSIEEHLSTTKSTSDSDVKISQMNCMKYMVSKNVSKLLKMDLSIKTENLPTNEPQVDKIQTVPDGCTSSDKNDGVAANTTLNTSGLLDTSKVVKNISTSSTDYTLVEDDENNDVIIYVSRKKRKKKTNH